MCDHKAAQIVDSTEVKEQGRFRERYECPCGATGIVTGYEEKPPSTWDRRGEVFA